MINKLRQSLNSLYGRFFEKGPTDDDFDQMRAWNISAQLAAVPPAYLKQVPPEVAALIRAAKELHPEMARGADEREIAGEPCPELG